MGEMVEFASNGNTAGGYMAPASEGAGLGVLVVHEWWGLVDHITEVCDRFSAEGFTALAPDLYHGRRIPNREPDEARKARMELDMDGAARDLSGAVDFLAAHPAVRGSDLGVVGFCVGGGLALWSATLRPDAIAAAVSFYGLPGPDVATDWSAMAGAVEGHFGDEDARYRPDRLAAFEDQLKGLDKDVRLFVYPGAGHAFFNDTRPDAYDEEAARQAWVRTLEFLRAKLG